MAGSASSRGSACKFTTWSLKGMVGTLGTYPGRGLRTTWESAGPNSRHESSTENACRSPTLLTVANAERSTVFRDRNLSSTDCRGSKGAPLKADRTEGRSQTTTCLDTCSRGTSARRKARSDHGLKVRRQDGVSETRYVPWRHAHLGTRSWSQRWSGVIWSNPSGVIAAEDAICPRSLWKCFSGTALLRWRDSRHLSIDWARSSERRAVRLTESNSLPRKEILCTGESLLFSRLTWSPNRLRCPKGRAYWYARPFVRKAESREDRDMEVGVFQVDRCNPIEGTDALKEASLRQHLERELDKGPVQNTQVPDWM